MGVHPTPHTDDMALSFVSLFFIGSRSCQILESSSVCTSSAPAGGADDNFKRIPVCSWCRCFVLFSSLAFSAASSHSTTVSAVQRIKAISPSPSPQPAQDHNSTYSALVIVVVSVCAIILVVMGFFTFLRFSINKKRKRSQRVGDAELPPAPPPTASADYTVRKFSWEEIVSLSSNLSTVIGQGGYSTVYLAEFADTKRGALKIYPNSERLNRIFKAELDILLHLRHENIVQLLGYCDNEEQGQSVRQPVSLYLQLCFFIAFLVIESGNDFDCR